MFRKCVTQIVDVVRGGDGDERAEDRHIAKDGGHEQHAHAELDQGLMLVADLRWKEAGREGIGAGLECACPGRATPTNWRCGRAARQHSAPQPGKQTLPTGRHFFRACRGEPEPGAEAAAKAEAGLRPEPMAGASDARPLFAQTAVHRSMPGGCIEQTPNKICSRGTRGLSDVGSARGACAAAAALRGHARVVQARVRRGVPWGWSAHSPPGSPPSKFSGRAK